MGRRAPRTLEVEVQDAGAKAQAECNSNRGTERHSVSASDYSYLITGNAFFLLSIGLGIMTIHEGQSLFVSRIDRVQSLFDRSRDQSSMLCSELAFLRR